MLSAKFKVGFVKLSLGIRRALKDILHDAVTSNLTLTAYRKNKKHTHKKNKNACVLKEDEKNERKKKCYASFRDSAFFFFFYSSVTCFTSQLTSNSIK